jgi:hypothetical protein
MEPSFNSVFVVVQNQGSGPRVARRIIKLSLHGSRPVRSRPLFGGDTLTVAGGALWVTGPVRRARREGVLHRLDPHSLRSVGDVRLPEPPASMVDTPAGLWVAAGRHLYLLDPDDGSIRRIVPIHGEANEIAVDVGYRYLFAATHPVGAYDSGALSDRSAADGELLKRADQSLAFAANSLTPAFGNVWVSSATGNFGAAFQYRDGALNVASKHTIEGLQGIQTSYSGGPHMWIVGRDLGPFLACADPRTGRLQGGVRLPDPFGVVTAAVSIANTVFVGTDLGVLRMKPWVCSPSGVRV